MARIKNSVPTDSAKIHGFFRLQVAEQDGKVSGDTGWFENQVTNDGFREYLTMAMAADAGSKVISHAMLGTGTAPAATDTALDGELTDVAGTRAAVTASTIASKTVQFAFTLASNIYTAPHTIRNVALINHSSTATAATIFAGNTFTTSNLATNQSVYGSYQIRFA
jgi:hypothetical protein